ncbi:MAG: metallopeptidase TldD-related protein [Cellulosilyticaceae bacterium]
MEQLRQIAGETINAFATQGIDKAYCVATKKETREFNVDGGAFSLFRTLFDHSLGMTIFKEGKKGSLSINRFDQEAIQEAVESCVQVAEGAQADAAWDIAPRQLHQVFVKGCPEPDTDRLFERTRELLETIQTRHPKIILEQMIVAHTKSQSVYKNTNNTQFETTEGEYSIQLMFSAHEGEKTTSFFGTGVVTERLDEPLIALSTIEKDLTDVENQLETTTLEGKFEGVVVLPPSCLQSLLYSILGNFVTDSVILNGTSIWKDKRQQRVADPRITIGMRPLDPQIVCGERYTAEGFISENYEVIKNGVLESFMLSLYTANKSGFERAKNTSHNMVIEPGDQSIEEIIGGIKKGIIVGRFSGGEPASNGDFSGVAKNSFLIEDGKIVGAVTETMISGNLAALLNHLVAISKEVSLDGYSVLPYMAFDGVVISGK